MSSLNRFHRNVSAAAALALLTLAALTGGCASGSQYTSSAAAPPATGEPRPAALDFEPTPARLERGRYLVEAVAACFHCHSDKEWQKPGAPEKAGRRGGGHDWSDYGFPGITAPNLTPDSETGAGKWTDETLARAIREGVGHDGRRLVPIMPYMNFRQMADEDVASIVAYLRSLPPVKNPLPKTSLPPEIAASLPPVEPVSSVPAPDLSDPVKRGAYLVRIASCDHCHTPIGPQGQPIAGLEFAGGQTLKGPWGEVASANLTPDASGISYYDEKLFLSAMHTGKVGARPLNSIMPWAYFGKMSDEDLKAIFAYLRTLKPVRHRVDNSEPPTACRLCGGMHGFGDRN